MSEMVLRMSVFSTLFSRISISCLGPSCSAKADCPLGSTSVRKLNSIRRLACPARCLDEYSPMRSVQSQSDPCYRGRECEFSCLCWGIFWPVRSRSCRSYRCWCPCRWGSCPAWCLDAELLASEWTQSVLAFTVRSWRWTLARIFCRTCSAVPQAKAQDNP